MNGPTTTSPVKPGQDCVQNSNSSFSLVVKGKKKEQDDSGPNPIKRAHISKSDDGDSVLYRPENVVKSQIAKITDGGGLVDFEGVEKLIQLMQGGEKNIDLAGRIMLVDVVTLTDKFDCLERFVQLRGVPVLDEWLQEVHKGKISEGGIKEKEKIVEKFLFGLLRALENLPVNLHALQTSNVGKSVNYLRSHKNVEIQKKARSLVDSWKKRVEAEMNIIDSTNVSNIQPSKEMDSKMMTPIKEEKSSTSSQSQNNSRSYSSDSLNKKSSNGTARLIVRLPNSGRSPAQSASGGGSVEEHMTVRHEIQEEIKNSKKENVGRQDCEKRLKSGKSFEACFSSINALIDSASGLCGDNRDEVGMNLLASVAAGEITKSDTTSSPLSVKCEEEEAKGELNNEQVNCSTTSINDTDIQQQEKQQQQQRNEIGSVDGDDNVVATVVEPLNQIVKIQTNPNDNNKKPNQDSSNCSNTEPNGDGTKNNLDNSGSSKDKAVKLDFDLNEGFSLEEDENEWENMQLPIQAKSSTVPLTCPIPFPISSMPGNYPTPIRGPITVGAAASKGPFMPPSEIFTRPKGGEFGWKGPAPTSAFRPAEPRKVVVGIFDLNVSSTDDNFVDDHHQKTKNYVGTPRDFDLNSGPPRD